MQSESSRVSHLRAYTVVELAIALVVIGALAGVAIPMFLGYQDRTNVTLAIVDIHQIETAVDLEIFERRQVPDSIAHLPESQILDPWGNPYQYANVSESAPPGSRGNARKDKRLVPINSDYDLYSMGKDGSTAAPLTTQASRDDIVRASDGSYVGLAENY